MDKNIHDIAGLLGSIVYSQVQKTVCFGIIVSEIISSIPVPEDFIIGLLHNYEFRSGANNI